MRNASQIKSTLFIFLVIVIFVLFILALFFFRNSTDTIVNQISTPTNTVSVSEFTPTTEVTNTESVTTITQNSSVKVYFSNIKLSDTDVYPVTRTTSRIDVAAFTIEEYISGPSSSEKDYSTEIKLTGDSNCDGKNFSINIVNKKATLKFCKTVELKGVLSDARLTKSLNMNLTQFPTIEKVVLLNKNGKCLIDYSGQNQCGQ